MDPKTNPPEWLKWDEESVRLYDKKQKKYSYVYGIKDMQIKYKEFESASVYVSKPFNIDGNVAEINLEVNEYNPIKDSQVNKAINPYDTSVEYYITFHENPTTEDWIPVLPKGQQTIENEVLLFRDSNTCSLRFQCDFNKEVIVYKNGVKLERQFWSHNPNNTISIDRNFDKYSIYTVQYYPDINVASPWNIELKEDDKHIVKFTDSNGNRYETFSNGAGRNGEVLLSKHPYIDYNKVNSSSNYEPIKVYLDSKDDIHMLSGPNKTTYKNVGPVATDTVKAYTKNITDYKYLTEPNLKPYDTTIDATNKPINLEFQYYQDGRKLYFTETFNNTNIITNQTINHGNAIIKVQYDYLKVNARLKIILRNTSNAGNTITPSVRDYSLIFKVVR